MVVLGIVARGVPDILLGTSVVTMQTTLAHNLAAQARTVNQAAGGRFTLGLGANQLTKHGSSLLRSAARSEPPPPSARGSEALVNVHLLRW